MSWTWQRIIGFGLVGLLVTTLIFSTSSGTLPKINGAHEKALSRVDDKVTEYD